MNKYRVVVRVVQFDTLMVDANTEKEAKKMAIDLEAPDRELAVIRSDIDDEEVVDCLEVATLNV